jgi:outer membrane protein, multidrug efflux system
VAIESLISACHRLRGARGALIALTAMLLCSCKLGPNYTRPDLQVPDQWSAESQRAFDRSLASRALPEPPSATPWWKIFGDPTLDRLMDSAVRQNLDVRQAALRIAESRAQRDVIAAALYPSLSGSGLGARTRMSENGIASALSGGTAGGAATSAPPSWFNFFQVGFDATWELDLFGRVRRGVEAADANVRSAEAARSDAIVSLTAEIARTYFTLRGAERQRNIALADVKTQERLQSLVASRNHAGFAPDSDVAAQHTQLSAARANIPQFEATIAQSHNRLALLLALPPGAVTDGIPSAELPELPPEVPVGLPGDLLRRRPDIREGEANLAAATARVGVAEASLFPSVTLGATAGLQSNATSTLFDWASRFVAGGADISVPIFTGGRLSGQVRIANLQQQEAVLTYRQTVLTAFHDVDNALIAYAADEQRARDVAQQLKDAGRSRDLAESRYKSGLSAYVEVLDAERQAHQAAQDLAQVIVTASTDLVALFKALGGGWDSDAAP